MPFWSTATLQNNLSSIVSPPPPAAAQRVEYASVTLTVGAEVYVTPHSDIKDAGSHTKQQLEANESFTIPAGQFAFLLTEEKVKIPFDAIGFISIKAKTKFKGLVNVSGFHVDPGYEGKLIFSVFNAGPAPVHLQRGLPLFMLWLATLDRAATPAHARTRPGYDDIPVEVINNIPGEIHSLQSLLKKLTDVEDDVRLFKQKIWIYMTVAWALAAILLRTLIAQDLGDLIGKFNTARQASGPSVIAPAQPPPTSSSAPPAPAAPPNPTSSPPASSSAPASPAAPPSQPATGGAGQRPSGSSAAQPPASTSGAPPTNTRTEQPAQGSQPPKSPSSGK